MRFRWISMRTQRKSMKGKGITEMLKQTVTLSRQQLYDEIWQMSVAGVARKHNLNYAKLIAKCKVADIPFPSSGFWARKNMGKDVSGEVVELPPSNIENVELLLAGVKVEKKKPMGTEKSEETDSDLKEIVAFMETGSEEISDESQMKLESGKPEENVYADNVLLFLEDDERRKVLKVASELKVRNGKKLHEQLVNYKSAMANWKKKEKEAQSKKGYNPRYNTPAYEPSFFNEISIESQQRAFLILSAIFCAVEELGGKVNADLSIRVKTDIVRVGIAEGQDKVKHELTKQEARELVEYNDRVKDYKWASRPKIRKYDYICNGKLRIIFGDGEYIRDNVSKKLEDRLGDILLRLYEKSERNRIEREKWEKEKCRREEEARKSEAVQRRKEDEIKKTKELLNQTEDYRIACEIRQYIAAVTQQKNMEPEVAEWIEWARKKADWFDPIVAAEDEYFGKREHSKAKEEKELDRLCSSRYRWN